MSILPRLAVLFAASVLVGPPASRRGSRSHRERRSPRAQPSIGSRYANGSRAFTTRAGWLPFARCARGAQRRPHAAPEDRSWGVLDFVHRIMGTRQRLQLSVTKLRFGDELNN